MEDEGRFGGSVIVVAERFVRLIWEDEEQPRRDVEGGRLRPSDAGRHCGRHSLGVRLVSGGTANGGNEEFIDANLAAICAVHAGGGGLVSAIGPVQQRAVDSWDRWGDSIW